MFEIKSWGKGVSSISPKSVCPTLAPEGPGVLSRVLTWAALTTTGTRRKERDGRQSWGPCASTFCPDNRSDIRGLTLSVQVPLPFSWSPHPCMKLTAVHPSGSWIQGLAGRKTLQAARYSAHTPNS